MMKTKDKGKNLECSQKRERKNWGEKTSQAQEKQGKNDYQFLT